MALIADLSRWPGSSMRYFTSILMLALFVGCAWAPHVPLPTVTDFDDYPAARTAYLRAYSAGYRARLKGDQSIYISSRPCQAHTNRYN